MRNSPDKQPWKPQLMDLTIECGPAQIGALVCSALTRAKTLIVAVMQRRAAGVLAVRLRLITSVCSR